MLAVFTAAPRPAITPHPSSPTTAGSAVGSTLVHCDVEEFDVGVLAARDNAAHCFRHV